MGQDGASGKPERREKDAMDLLRDHPLVSQEKLISEGGARGLKRRFLAERWLSAG